MRTWSVLALLVPLVAGCGRQIVTATSSAEAPERTRTTLYFLAEGGAVPLGVRREIVERTPPPSGSVAGGALEALLADPTKQERSAGLTTAIPPRTGLVALTFRGEGGTGAVVGLLASRRSTTRSTALASSVRSSVPSSGSRAPASSASGFWRTESRGARTSWTVVSTTVRSITRHSWSFTSGPRARGRRRSCATGSTRCPDYWAER
jgi:hypothetical protein